MYVCMVQAFPNPLRILEIINAKLGFASTDVIMLVTRQIMHVHPSADTTQMYTSYFQYVFPLPLTH